MSTGPILIFDKSLLQALHVDECVWLGQFYRVNMTPVFFMETLADLEKKVAEGRTPEQVVGALASKTSAMTVDANAHHLKMCTADLLGNSVEMRGVVAVAGGRSVAKAGKRGLVFEVSEEAKALGRWQRGAFLEVEREHAKQWRAWLKDLDLDSTHRSYRNLVEGSGKPRDLEAVKSLADMFLDDRKFAETVLGLVLNSFVPREFWGDIFTRWRSEGNPPLRAFAPYAAHALNVELFFSLAIGASLISKDRPSNKIDMAYLYYLPFCMVFTSSDKLHQQTVPLFMNGLKTNQQFIWGPDMKADLRRLDDHFSALPEETRKTGVMSFAHRPPPEGGFIVTAMWDRFLRPTWRDQTRAKPMRDAEQERKLIEELKSMSDSPPARDEVGVDEADFVSIVYKVPTQVGKWRILPPGAEDKKRDAS